ncbi:MAG TPA: family 10 glycosylhydrolase, partial [Pirellulales bacterium]|nr:family 10 glycosylhydrolase [Pirellulales bacterium]
MALLAIVATGSLRHAARASETPVALRVRVEWGGSTERRWQGEVAVPGGALSELRPMGLEADEPGSMWVDGDRLFIASPSPRIYDGFDVLVTAPLGATMHVKLRAGDQAPMEFDIPLERVIDDFFTAPLGNDGSRLLARRAPGDKLRVQFDRDSLVFAAGEQFNIGVRPIVPAFGAGARVRLQARLLAARSDRPVWNDDREIFLGDMLETQPPVSFAVALPEAEGVYDLVLTASRKALSDRLGLRSMVEERRVQLVVVAADRPELPATAPTFEVLVEIDPANPRWWERLTNLPLVPGYRRGPLGNDALSPRQHPLGALVQLGPGGRDTAIAWEAYPLPVGRPGQPHLLEVEYPSDVPQHLGISVVEPNAAGAVLPIGLDSGVYTAAEAATDTSPSMLKHRVVFWPRTASPLALVTNRQDGSHAVYGKLRLLGPRGPSRTSLSNLSREIPGLGRDAPEPEVHLPRFAPPGATASDRLCAVMFNRPLFPENFSGEQASDPLSGHTGRTFDDWTTFYQGASRLVEYLHYVGYDAAMIAVLADGSTIYPSAQLEPTPRFDDGAFFSSGQDAVRKDVLELLLRLFDREQLRLVPALQFSAPLPRLEAIRRRGGNDALGIELVGADGKPWLARHAPRQHLAPYYNPLNPMVQEAMLDVVRELVERYGKHPALAGLALNLAADGYAQFPGDAWGYDDETLARFERETRVDLGPAGPEHLERRAALLADRYRTIWLEWRARGLLKFYQRVADVLAEARPNAKLYLATGDIFSRPELHRALHPALPRNATPEDLLLRVGIAASLYDDAANVVLLRPQRVAPLVPLASQATNLEINLTPEFDDDLHSKPSPGALLLHERHETTLPSFDAKSPFRKTQLRLVTQSSPSGDRNRQRFAHALAVHDCQAIFDGGWLLPLGQEDAVREMLGVYRQLPATAFAAVEGATQPVVLRTAVYDGHAWLYAVNDSPWNLSVTLPVTAGDSCRMHLLTTRHAVVLQGEGTQRVCTIDLRPYDLVGAMFSSDAVRFGSPQLKLPGKITDQLDIRIADLWNRAASLKSPSHTTALMNADFEQPPERTVALPGWHLNPRSEATATLDAKHVRLKGQSMHLHSGDEGAQLTSLPVAKPATGRLSLAVWLRVDDESRQPTVRLGIQAVGDDKYSRFAVVGGSTGQKLQTTWGQYIFPVHDLPGEAVASLEVKFELVGSGDVWIDDV